MTETPESPLPARLLRNVTSNYVAQLVSLATIFFLTPFVLGHLGRAGYGLWALTLAIVGYGVLLDLGLTGAAVKYTADLHARGEYEEANRVIATILTLYTGLGAAFVAVAGVLALVVPRVIEIPAEFEAEAPWLILVAGIGAGAALPCATALSVLRGLQRFDVASAIAIAATLLGALATVLVLELGGGLLGLAVVNAVTTPLMQIPVLLALRRIEPRLRVGWRSARRSEARRVFSFSSYVAVIQFSGLLTARTDPIVIGAALRVASVTPYALAQRLAQVVTLMTTQFVRVTFPFASERAALGDERALRRVFVGGTRVTIAVALPLTLALGIAGGDVLALWVGEEYREYAYLVTILAVNGLLDVATYPGTNVLMAIERHRWIAWSSLADGLLNLALSIALVLEFGLAGVAAATVISTVVVLSVSVVPYTTRTLGVPVAELARATLVPLLLPTAVFLAVLLGLRQVVSGETVAGLLAGLVPAGLAYAAAYATIGAPRGERNVYRSWAASVAARMPGRRAR